MEAEAAALIASSDGTSSAVAKPKLNPIDQAKLDYILSMLKTRAAKKEGSAGSGDAAEEEKEPPKILAAWIEEIDNMGQLTVKFNQSLNAEITPSLDKIDNSVVKLTLKPS